MITYGWNILNRAFPNAFKQAALLKDVIVILIDIFVYAKVYGFDHKNHHNSFSVFCQMSRDTVIVSKCHSIIDSTYPNIITASMAKIIHLCTILFANRKLTEGTGIQPIGLLFTHRPIMSQMDAIWNVFTPINDRFPSFNQNLRHGREVTDCVGLKSESLREEGRRETYSIASSLHSAASLHVSFFALWVCRNEHIGGTLRAGGPVAIVPGRTGS